MADSRFFNLLGPLRLKELAEITRAEIAGNLDLDRSFDDVQALDDAGETHVSFLDNKKYAGAFAESKAGACIIRPEYLDRAPPGMSLLVTSEPYLGYAKVAQRLYPTSKPSAGISPQAMVDPRALVGVGTRIDPGAVILSGAEIGANCIIGSNSVVGSGVTISDDCRIGANVTLSHCCLGHRVILHPGVRIGQDGFGFALTAAGHEKVPQLGRVIVEDDVEIGANSTIDRGAGPDTVIGAGTKIDNLVQIAHNVKLGRGCIVVSQVGISGSTEIGDFVMIGGQAGLTGHLEVGSGSRIAAQSGVMRNVEAGATIGGSPAKPMRDWLKEVAFVERMVKNKSK